MKVFLTLFVFMGTLKAQQVRVELTPNRCSDALGGDVSHILQALNHAYDDDSLTLYIDSNCLIPGGNDLLERTVRTEYFSSDSNAYASWIHYLDLVWYVKLVSKKDVLTINLRDTVVYLKRRDLNGITEDKEGLLNLIEEYFPGGLIRDSIPSQINEVLQKCYPDLQLALQTGPVFRDPNCSVLIPKDSFLILSDSVVFRDELPMKIGISDLKGFTLNYFVNQSGVEHKLVLKSAGIKFWAMLSDITLTREPFYLSPDSYFKVIQNSEDLWRYFSSSVFKYHLREGWEEYDSD